MTRKRSLVRIQYGPLDTNAVIAGLSAITRHRDGAANLGVSVTDRNRPRELSDAVQANTHLANVTEPSGRAVVTLSSRISGHRGRDVFLGRYGLQESRGEYARVLAEWNIAGTHLGRAGDSLTIVELCLAHVDTRAPYYRKEGEPRLRWAAIIASLIALQKVYGRSPLKLCGRQ